MAEQAKMPLNRQELLEKLLKSYQSSYDITRLDEVEPDGLCATAHFHVEESSYILSQKATMWSTHSDEHVWFFSVPELTDSACDACIRRAYDEGMAKIDLGSEGGQHMVTRLTAVFLCEHAEESARSHIRKCRLYKSFQFSLKGWMEFHAVAVETSSQTVISNGHGRETAKHLKKLLQPPKGGGGSHWRSIVKQMLG